MFSRDIGLEYKLVDRRNKKKRLEDRIAKINKKIAEGIDFEEEERLETRKNNTFDEISQVAQEIIEIERVLQSQLQQGKEGELLAVLQANDSSLKAVIEGYRFVTTVWQVVTPSNVSDFVEIVRELERLGSRREEDYTAIEAFAAYLLSTVEDNTVIAALNTWGDEYFPERNWFDLYAKLEAELADQAKSYRPAILVNLALAEEETTQSDNEARYYLQAWFVENLDAYQRQGKRRTGFHPLISPGTTASKPFLLDELESKAQSLLNQCLAKARELMLNEDQDPEFFIFLPVPLLRLAADYWPLQAEMRLGQNYSVVVCCADRWEPVYPRKPWNEFWQKYENALEKVAQRGFEEITFNGPEDLGAALGQAVGRAKQSEEIVGFKICSVPCELTTELLFGTLLRAGIPLAIWGRCQHPGISRSEELGRILEADILKKLPQTVQAKRDEAGLPINPPDRHIGHHLSLLKDNPRLPLPVAYRSA